MELNLNCLEWTNINRDARVLNEKLKQKKAMIQNGEEHLEFGTYLVQIAGRQDSMPENSKLSCLSSDNIVYFYEQSNLKQLSKIDKPHGYKTVTEIGYFKQQIDSHLFFTSGDDSRFKCWDLRLNNKTDADNILSIDCSTMDSHEILCSDINSTDTLIAIGTNKKIDDSLVYIYDIRFHSKYLYKFCESHSNDVSQVKFDPLRANKFISGSLDGLVCLYDLGQRVEVKNRKVMDLNSDDEEEEVKNSNEDDEESDDQDEDPDLMEQVFNTDSSIQKIGYLSSAGPNSEPDQLFAITFTNDLFIYDLSTHDLIYRSPKALKTEEDQEDEDYFFDCFYRNKLNSDKYELTALLGDKFGNIKIYEKERMVFGLKEEKEGTKSRKHRDIIRSSYWNHENLFTVGEDGFLLKWKLDPANVSLNSETKQLKRALNKEESSSSDDLHKQEDLDKKRKNRLKKKKLNLKNSRRKSLKNKNK